MKRQHKKLYSSEQNLKMQTDDEKQSPHLAVKMEISNSIDNKCKLRDICCCHQQFARSGSISSLNIYLDERFWLVLKGENPMELVCCKNCGVNLISISGDNGILQNNTTAFEHTFAAYYNTSQVNGNQDILQ